jgi:quercetin dioxygenase-like cupin family protein
LTGLVAELTLPGVGDSGARLTVLATTGSGLSCALAEVPPRARHVGSASSGGELWFVIDGSGSLALTNAQGDRAPGPALVPDRGLWIPPGSGYEVACEGVAELRFEQVALPATNSAGAVLPVTAAGCRSLSRDLRDCPAETTGDRTFRVLFGPGRDCAAATQFVGEIPPGRAPAHRHPYDEVVLILAGAGVAHVDGTERPLSAGAWLHLPPGREHCLENTGPDVMRVLGVFHPADSPAVKLAGSETARATAKS